MNKDDIINKVASAEDIPAEEAEAVIDELLSLIRNRMRDGEETQIYGFGKFGVRWWKGRTGRDPQTGEEIEIDGRWIPYWSPSSTLVDDTDPAGKSGAAGGATIAKKDTEQEKTDSSEVTEQKEIAEKSSGDKADESEEKAADSIDEADKSIDDSPARDDDEPSDEKEDERDTDQWDEQAGDDEQRTRPQITFGDEVEPEDEEVWPDIGDEISLRELRFISERLKQETEKRSGGLFSFEEEEQEEQTEEKQQESEKELSDTDSDTFPLVVDETGEEPHGHWQAVDRSPNRFGWSMILVLASALLVFGAYLVFNGNEGPVEPNDLTGTMESEEQPGNIDQSDQTQTDVLNQTAANAGPGNVMEAVSYEPYDLPVPQRAAFLEIYNTALNQIQSGDYSAAELTLHRLLVSDPPGDYVDNLHYWLGESLFAREQYREAIREFEKVFSTPYMNKVEDSLIMMASAYLRLGEWDEASRILWKFPTQYPNSEHTALANQWIEEYQLGSAPPIPEGETG